MRSAGLFAGIGGIELGLERAGFEVALVCEIDPAARHVLQRAFPQAVVHDDIRTLSDLADVDIVSAGFPCQDLSQAGATAGIDGTRSGLVTRIFDLLASKRPSERPSWILIENVPFMLRLNAGRAMRYLTASLVELGYAWAYRVVDSQAFGLPQRRLRVFLLASRVADPAPVLLGEDSGPAPAQPTTRSACGFYWTEGNRGVGWAVNAVPPLKGSSGLGIPSPPALWMLDGRIVVPDVRDAERLQGFPADWTLLPTEMARSVGARWRLVGNAVSVPVAEWIGQRLLNPSHERVEDGEAFGIVRGWPTAGLGSGTRARKAEASPWPRKDASVPIEDFLAYPPHPLSERATRGFLRRLTASKLRVPPEFVRDLRDHIAAMQGETITTNLAESGRGSRDSGDPRAPGLTQLRPVIDGLADPS